MRTLLAAAVLAVLSLTIGCRPPAAPGRGDGAAAPDRSDGTAAAPSGGAAQAPADAPVPDGGAVYEHALGFRLRTPAGWKIEAQAAGAMLTPPDLARERSDPVEAYAVDAVSAAGVEAADDERLKDALDKNLTRMLPGLTFGGSELLPGAGRGVFTWERAGADGRPIRVRVYVALVNRFALTVVGVGLKDHVDARDAALRSVIASADWPEVKRDPDLVGAWRHENFYQSGYGDAAFSGSSWRTIVLEADGSFAEATGGAASGAADVRSEGALAPAGAWAAAGGAVYLFRDNGNTAKYSYRFVDGRLLLTPDGGKRQIWERVR
jgi:hypothetical protein